MYFRKIFYCPCGWVVKSAESFFTNSSCLSLVWITCQAIFFWWFTTSAGICHTARIRKRILKGHKNKSTIMKERKTKYFPEIVSFLQWYENEISWRELQIYQFFCLPPLSISVHSKNKQNMLPWEKYLFLWIYPFFWRDSNCKNVNRKLEKLTPLAECWRNLTIIPISHIFNFLNHRFLPQSTSLSPFALLLTNEMTTASFSLPWKPSTVFTSTPGKSLPSWARIRSTWQLKEKK